LYIRCGYMSNKHKIGLISCKISICFYVFIFLEKLHYPQQFHQTNHAEPLLSSYNTVFQAAMPPDHFTKRFINTTSVLAATRLAIKHDPPPCNHQQDLKNAKAPLLPQSPKGSIANFCEYHLFYWLNRPHSHYSWLDA
jgi:hypothetical protein